jgi:hypothetical protein
MARKKKISDVYKTIQVKKEVHEQIVDYCNKNGLKIGRYVELLFLNEVSGSLIEQPTR